MSNYEENVFRSQTSDFGPNPYVTNISAAARQNNNFRTAIWTGKHLQATLMSVIDEIGLEMHPDVDQFLYIEEGTGRVSVGDSKKDVNHHAQVTRGFGIFVPAGTWHNVVNLGDRPLKLYTIYAPPEHPHGTVHITRQDAEEAERAQAGNGAAANVVEENKEEPAKTT